LLAELQEQEASLRAHLEKYGDAYNLSDYKTDT
jgi:hypothetical protein